ncbi:L3 protein [Human papillomavirus type 5b]|uniref:Probable protein L3 n=1 Tax=Human papillomavirus type 5b TaxID=10599 RepID=VL3_HPV5B|nr:RecName: Full=Probable protein L3 [Human papillomavirus type 5b]BAA14299.1 L3 protein [Human papillomavirus type 5b]
MVHIIPKTQRDIMLLIRSHVIMQKSFILHLTFLWSLYTLMTIQGTFIYIPVFAGANVKENICDLHCRWQCGTRLMVKYTFHHRHRWPESKAPMNTFKEQISTIMHLVTDC